jgi:hypothetical protein
MAKRPNKTYRTAAGQTVDFGALLSQNETVPAIGNMNVNARGDEIAPSGDIVKTRDQVMKEYHQMNTMVPQDGRIPESADDTWQDWEPKVEKELVKNNAPAVEDVLAVCLVDVAEEPVVAEEAPVNAQEEVVEEVKEEPRPSAGLASAVAAAKTVGSTVKKPTKPSEVSGVTRL